MSKADCSGENGFVCAMCGKTIDLNIDDIAGEDGHVMHFECYSKRVRGLTDASPVCPICGKPCSVGNRVTNAEGCTLHRECYRNALIEGWHSL